jgi:hypothetical protein
LARIEYARGLITYLFAVGTIGSILVVILATLLGEESIEEKIRRAKDILTMLIGLFGTIVGFYFGAQVSQGESQASPFMESAVPAIEIALPLVSVATGELPAVEQSLEVSTTLTGGVPPYAYWILVDSQTAQGTTKDRLLESLTVTPATGSLTVVLFVKDDTGSAAVAETTLPVREP